MNRIRIDFLDGVRGLSAVLVVLYHSLLFTKHKIQYSHHEVMNYLQKFISIGYLAVPIFIILSGFCLAIPVVQNDLKLKGGFIRYIKRRAKRIIPPYYAALFLSILIIAIFPILQIPHATAWDSKIPVNWQNTFAHVLLIHNLNSNWIYKINGAHWSVATEWQIYFIFPLMLFLWRKYNLTTVILVVIPISLILQKIIPNASPIFIIYFLLGVISANFSFISAKIKIKNWHLFICVLSLIPAFFLVHLHIKYSQLFFAIIFSILLFILVKLRLNSTPSILDIILSSRFPMFFGKISYSLYLIHGPILALCNLYMLKEFNLSYDAQLLIMWGIVAPISVLLAYLFYLIVERRFIN